MSLCFRVLPGRLSSLVSGRKPLSKLDRHQLRKHVESSAFLKQFLGTQRALSIKANTTGEMAVPSMAYMLQQNLSLVSLNPCYQSDEKPIRHYNNDKNRNTIYWAQKYRWHKPQRLNITITKSKKYVATIGMPDNVTVFQTQNVTDNQSNSFLDNNKVIVSSIASKNLYNSQMANLKNDILLTDAITLKTSQQQSQQDNENKPSQEQLQCVFDFLSQELPKLFAKPQSYAIYTQDLLFINNIRGITTKGLLNYAKQLALLRVIGHIRFAHVKLDIIKITTHTEDATVKVRWRIRGVTGMKVFISFWKFKIWKIQEAIERDQETWYDGFSTFYVNSEGKVYKHVADKVIPDQSQVTDKKNLRIAPKLALFTGLTNVLDNAEDFFGLNSTFKLH